MTGLIDRCPVCGRGDLVPHCPPSDPRRYSTTCDVVTCDRCGEMGTLDGRYWQDDSNDEEDDSGKRFSRIRRTVEQLRNDTNERGQ